MLGGQVVEGGQVNAKEGSEITDQIIGFEAGPKDGAADEEIALLKLGTVDQPELRVRLIHPATPAAR